MPRLILIRPCETDHQLEGRLLGRKDVDLNDEGRYQAGRLAEFFSGWKLDFLALSPLKRALSTAMPIVEPHGITPRMVPGFQGMDYGDWDGQRETVIRSEDARRFESWLEDPDFPAPGGECLRDVYARVYPSVAEIVEYCSPGETVAFIVQEGVMRVLCCILLDLPLSSGRRFTMEHGAVGVFERAFEGGPYRLRGWNQTDHLLSLVGPGSMST